MITNSVDRWSDLDFVLVAKDERYEEALAGRRELAASLGTLVAAFTGEHVGEPRLLICLYDAPALHVDLKVVRLDAFAQRVEDPTALWERGDALSAVIAARPGAYPRIAPQWIEDRFWVWGHYVATKVGRGELFEAYEGLSFLRMNALAPLAKRLRGHDQRGVRFVERELPDLLDGFRATVAPRVDAIDIAQGLERAIELYRTLRRELAPGEVAANARAERVSLDYLAQARRGLA